jgi:hypothetical protein
MSPASMTKTEVQFRQRIGLLTDGGKARLVDYDLAELAALDRPRFLRVMETATDRFLEASQVPTRKGRLVLSLWELVEQVIRETAPPA